MTADYSTGALIRRALQEAPVFQEGLRFTLFLAMAGQAVTVVTPIVIQQIIDKEILGPDGIDMSNVVAMAGVALVALVIGVVVGRISLLRLVRSSSSGLSDLRTKTFDHLLRQSVLHVQAEELRPFDVLHVTAGGHVALFAAIPRSDCASDRSFPLTT